MRNVVWEHEGMGKYCKRVHCESTLVLCVCVWWSSRAISVYENLFNPGYAMMSAMPDWILIPPLNHYRPLLTHHSEETGACVQPVSHTAVLSVLQLHPNHKFIPTYKNVQDTKQTTQGAVMDERLFYKCVQWQVHFTDKKDPSVCVVTAGQLYYSTLWVLSVREWQGGSVLKEFMAYYWYGIHHSSGERQAYAFRGVGGARGGFRASQVIYFNHIYSWLSRYT